MTPPYMPHAARRPSSAWMHPPHRIWGRCCHYRHSQRRNWEAKWDLFKFSYKTAELGYGPRLPSLPSRPRRDPIFPMSTNEFHTSLFSNPPTTFFQPVPGSFTLWIHTLCIFLSSAFCSEHLPFMCLCCCVWVWNLTGRENTRCQNQNQPCSLHSLMLSSNQQTDPPWETLTNQVSKITFQSILNLISNFRHHWFSQSMAISIIDERNQKKKGRHRNPAR